MRLLPHLFDQKEHLGKVLITLVEAVPLCLIGSLVGVALGVGTGELIQRFSEIPVLLNIPIIFIAISSAAIVGIFFGFYPARKASRRNPIDALRYE